MLRFSNNLSAACVRCNLQTHQHCSKWEEGQYILWLVALIFQVLKLSVERKNEVHRIKLYFLEMNDHVLSYHSHKKRKDSLETRSVLLIFLLELKISGVAVQSIHQNIKKWWLLLWITFVTENDFKHVLATFCCYDHGTKIATDQKEYRKCFLCDIICWIAKIFAYQSIAVKEGWLGTRKPPA